MNVPICSESAIDLIHSNNNFYNEQIDTIILHTRERNYPIKIDFFLQYSQKFQKLKNNFPQVIDLTCYNVEAVRSLADYLCNVDLKNIRLNSSMLLDLLQLCRMFEITCLIDFLCLYIIENIDFGKDSPSAFVFNVTIIMSDWTLISDDRVRSRLLATAALIFPQIQTSSYLAKFPLVLMKLLLGRCELQIESELDVAIFALKWFQFQKFTKNDVSVIFSTVRTLFLSVEEKTVLNNKAKEMGFTSNVIETFNMQLNSLKNTRCCLIKTHIKNKYKRCGVPKNADNSFIQTFLTINLQHKV